MAYRKYKLGDLVEQYDEINQNGEFTEIDDLQGINSNKYFQECKSNKNDIDLFRYRICRHGMFSYNRATSRNGEKISIALRTGDDCIVSPSYYCFRVKDEEVLCPEYLDIWFKRPVFDRYARFNSWGSATEFFTFDDFCATEIMLPSLPEQRKIVHDYQVITDRIELLRKMNEKLEEQIMAVYHQMFDGVCRDGTVAELGDVVGGATPSTENAEYYCSDGIVWLSPKDLTGTGFKFIFKGETDITEEGYNSCSTKMLPKGSVLLTSRAPVGAVAIAMKELCTNQGFKSIVPKAPYWTPYIYCLLKDSRQLLEANASGTTFLEISGDTLKKLVVPIPEEKLVEKFSRICEPIFKQQMLFEKELTQLNSLVSIRVSSIAKGA